MLYPKMLVIETGHIVNLIGWTQIVKKGWILLPINI